MYQRVAYWLPLPARLVNVLNTLHMDRYAMYGIFVWKIHLPSSVQECLEKYE